MLFLFRLKVLPVLVQCNVSYEKAMLMLTILELLVTLLSSPGSGLGYRKQSIHTDDILLDGKIYRQVGEYNEYNTEHDDEDRQDQRSPLQWIYNSVKEFWNGKKSKHKHQHHGKLKRENSSHSMKKVFKLTHHFKSTRNQADFRQIKDNPSTYKPKYTFKSKQEKFFSSFSKEFPAPRL